MSASEIKTQPLQAIRRFLLVLLIVTIGVVTAIFVTRARLLASPEQPIAYSHQTHIEAGIQCQVIATEDETVQQLTSYWERGETIPWVRVNYQPDFVYFSHQPHLGAGINCETCHGDVSTMDEARPVYRMDMGWCLECHEVQDTEHVTRLTDCISCHK